MKRFWPFFLLLASVLPAAPGDSSLAERLVSPVAEIRDGAIVEFRKLPLSVRERFVPSLMVAMGDENPYVRDQAASLLKELGVDARPNSGPGTVPGASAQTLQARDAERQKALADIQGVKTDRYQNLKSSLEQEKRTQPDWMAMKGAGGQTDIKNLLLQGLSDPDPLIRSRSARRLGMIHPTPMEALPALEMMLGDKDADCRSAAAVALGSFGSAARGLSTQVGVLLNDPDEKVRVSAREALRQIQGLP